MKNSLELDVISSTAKTSISGKIVLDGKLVLLYQFLALIRAFIFLFSTKFFLIFFLKVNNRIGSGRFMSSIGNQMT